MKMQNAGVQAIVLDLRKNGGGLLNEAVDMTGLFISEALSYRLRILTTKYSLVRIAIRKSSTTDHRVLTSRLALQHRNSCWSPAKLWASLGNRQ